MPISSQLLASIQVAGASIAEADTELKSAVDAYAAKVATAMHSNPFDVVNDSIFEDRITWNEEKRPA